MAFDERKQNCTVYWENDLADEITINAHVYIRYGVRSVLRDP